MARAYIYSYSRHYHTLHQHLNDVGRASVFYWSPFQRHGGWRRCILNKYIFFSFDCILISRFHMSSFSSHFSNTIHCFASCTTVVIFTICMYFGISFEFKFNHFPQHNRRDILLHSIYYNLLHLSENYHNNFSTVLHYTKAEPTQRHY